MNAPLDPSISDLLRGSSLAPMMDQPVSHILHGMGLPQLPVIPPMPPLPGLPPMPTIDLAAIVRPLTDMASCFGTGQFGGGAVHSAVASVPPAPPATSNPVNNPATQNNSPATQNNAPATQAAPRIAAPATPRAAAPQPAPPAAPAGTAAPGSPTAAHPNADPTQVLQAITTGLETAMQLGMSALQMVMELWQGQGAQQAASTSAQSQNTGTQLATQSTGQKAILGAGATSVFTGGGLMAAVVSKYVTTLALTAPALSVPGGSAFVVAETAEAIAEALAVITATRVEMMIHSANMIQAGQKVPVSSTPTGVSAASQASTAADTASASTSTSSASSSSELEQLMQMISPIGQMLSTGVQSATQLGSEAGPLVPGLSAKAASAVAGKAGALGAYQGSDSKDSAADGAGGAGDIAGIPATPLTPYIGTELAGGSAEPGGAAASEALASEPMATSTPMATSSPGMMPMSGAGAAAAATKGGAAAGAVGGAANSNLVTASNGDAVVGNIEGATLPVVGALVRAVEAPPDKELTL